MGSRDALFISNEILQLHELTASEKIYLAIWNQYKDNLVEFDWWLNTGNNFSKSNIAKMRRHLKQLGYITENKLSDPYKAREFTMKNSHRGKKCEWCGRYSYVLHKHHFPISRAEGGTDTVCICPNCHSTYHAVLLMEDNT